MKNKHLVWWAIGIAIALVSLIGWQIWQKMGQPPIPLPDVPEVRLPNHHLPWWTIWVSAAILALVALVIVRSAFAKPKKASGSEDAPPKVVTTEKEKPVKVEKPEKNKEEKKGKPLLGPLGKFALILVVLGMLLPLCGEAYRNHQLGKTTQVVPAEKRWWFEKTFVPTSGRPDGSIKPAKLVTVTRWDRQIIQFRVSWWTIAGTEKATDFRLENPGEQEPNTASGSTEYAWDKFTSPRHGTWTMWKKGNPTPIATGKWVMRWSEGGQHYVGSEQDTDGVWHAFVLRPDKGR